MSNFRKFQTFIMCNKQNGSKLMMYRQFLMEILEMPSFYMTRLKMPKTYNSFFWPIAE